MRKREETPEIPGENRVLNVVKDINNATHERISGEGFTEYTAADEGAEASYKNCSAENRET